VRGRGALVALVTSVPAMVAVGVAAAPATAQVEPGMPCDPSAGGVFVTPSGDILVCRPQADDGSRDGRQPPYPADPNVRTPRPR
jgi:hypothetical protein